MAPINRLPASFDLGDENVSTGPDGQVAHRRAIAHSDRFERKVWSPRPGVWSVVGNGLSNQSFVEGPDGLLCIDTGESNQEMAWALQAVRAHTDAPIAAVLYTHFHYVGGTRAAFDDAGRDVPIWGHAGIEGNLQRIGGEVAPAAQRGLVHQMAILLPNDGPDGVVNLGLGKEFRHPDHAPFTREVLLPTDTFDEPTTLQLAGLTVEVTPAPSDADDSVTFWFPDLGVAVNNILWPTLFNVFAIRGEEYRDPRVLLTGLDHLQQLGAEHLVGTHGPPISGADRIRADVEEYRDSIQFLWDQTVRLLNRGLTVDELTVQIQLPDAYDRTYLTQQYYGLAEHHIRQIHAGLRGWFDGNEALLFPEPPFERVNKLIAGFGGVDEVRRQARAALDDHDLRWALELASWLVRREVDDRGRLDGGSPEDRALLADALRAVAQRTTSANARNWCLTRALELDGSLDLARFRVHRFSRSEALTNPADSVRTLRVLLDPASADGLDRHVRWRFDDGPTVGLHIRRSVAVPTDGATADVGLVVDRSTWADIVSGRIELSAALESGVAAVDGDVADLLAALSCFDHPTLGR